MHKIVLAFFCKTWNMLFLPRPPVFSDKYIIIKELVFSRPHLTPPVRPPIDLTYHLPSCRPDFRLILFPLAHSKCVRVLLHRTLLCELTQSPMGGLRWGLWEVLREVLREVFQVFPFHNSIILNDLWKTTGGLGKKIENWRLKREYEDWKITKTYLCFWPICIDNHKNYEE